MAEIATGVMEVIAARMRTTDGKIDLTTPLDSLGLESLDILEIILDLEQRFEIEIPYNVNTKLEFDTVSALVQAIERLNAEKAGSK